MTKKIIIPYVAAILAMVVCISVAADDGAVVARSYAGYNNQNQGYWPVVFFFVVSLPSSVTTFPSLS